MAEVSGGPPPQRPFTVSWAFKGVAVGVLLALAAAILGRLRRRRWANGEFCIPSVGWACVLLHVCCNRIEGKASCMQLDVGP